MAENDNCQICRINKSKYSCPRCEISYCSVSCYQSENHLQCSEIFYEKWVHEELKNYTSNSEVKKRMVEILKQNLNTKSEESLDSDDDEAEPDLANRMMGVNLDDEAAVWEKLTSAEKKEFRKLVATGNIMKILPEWEPWWKTKKRKILIQDFKEYFDWKSICPELPSDIPQLFKLTKTSPSPNVAFMLLNVLMSYVFTVRWFKGAHKNLPVESISTCIALSASLRNNTDFTNDIEAFAAFRSDCIKCEWVKGDAYNKNVLMEDLVDIIKGSNGNDIFFCVKAAICDLKSVCSLALLILQEGKNNHLKRFSGPLPEVITLRKISKKMTYYLSWTLDYGSSLINILFFLEMFNYQKLKKLTKGESAKELTDASSNTVSSDKKPHGLSSYCITTSGCIKISRELKCPKGSTAVAYTDDLDLLASGQEDGSILLFGNEGEPRMLFDYETRLHAEPCTDLKIKSSPKGGYNKTLLAGYLDGRIKLWDTCIGKVLFTLKENRQLYGLKYHPRSHKFISVGNDFKVNIYDEETRVTERVLSSSGIKGTKSGHTDSVCSATFHPYNPFELISGGIDNTIQFWDIRAPYAIRRIEGVSMYGDALDLTEDGKVVLCGLSSTWESPIHIYDYATAKLLKSYVKSGCFVYCCKFLAPAFVGVGGFYHHMFKIVNMITPTQVCGYMTGLPDCVINFALRRKVPRFRTYPDKLPTLALSSGDRVYEIEIVYPEEHYVPSDFYYKHFLEMDSASRAIKTYYTTILSQIFSPNGNFLLAGSNYGEVFVFDIQSILNPENEVQDLKQKCHHKFIADEYGQVCSMASTDKFLIVGSYGKIIGFEWKYINLGKTPKIAWCINMPQPKDAIEVVEVSALLVGANGRIYSGCGDNKIHIHSLEDGKLIRSLSGHKSYIHDIAFMDGDQLASAGEDGYVNIWDCRTSKAVCSIEPHKETSLHRPNLGKWIGCVNVEKDWLICAGGPKPGLWHVGTMQLTAAFEVINKEIHVCKMSEEKVLIGTGNKLSQFTLQGDPVCCIPSSSSTIYSLLLQQNPNNIMVFAGTSPEIDFCTNFHYKDQVLLCSA